MVDPAVEAIIREEADKAGVTRRDFSADDIRTRILTAMINEAAKILDEGIAQSAADIDLVLLHGYGFPRWRGGPLHYADTLGAAAILRNIEHFAAEDPVVWRASPLIARLAHSGGRFADARPHAGQG